MSAQNGFSLFASLNIQVTELIPLTVLLICIGLFCGTASLLMGVLVSKSRLAFCCGLIALASGFLSPALIWILAGRHLSPHGYLLLASPLLPGLLGVGLSQIPSGIWLRRARTAIVMTAIVAAILGGRNWYAEPVADRNLLDSLHGSKRVEVA